MSEGMARPQPISSVLRPGCKNYPRVALFGLLVALGGMERNAEAGAYWGLTGGPVTRSAAPRFAPALSDANATATTAQIPFALRFSKWKFLSFGAGGYFDLALNGDLENDIGGFAFGRVGIPPSIPST